MKLTKLQRHTAYIILLAEAEERIDDLFHVGFCWLTNEIFRLWIYNEPLRGDSIKVPLSKLFPELSIRMPKEQFGNYWFNTKKEGWEKRIELLKQCIIETA